MKAESVTDIKDTKNFAVIRKHTKSPRNKGHEEEH